MAIDYSHIKFKGPNAAWMAEIDQKPSLLTARQEAEAYRMASQANRNFNRGGYQSPQEALQGGQATTPPTPSLSQLPGLSGGFAEGYGRDGYDGSFSQPGTGGGFRSAFGPDRDLAGLTSMGWSQAGLPFGGIAGQALFGDEAGMKNAAIGTGLGMVARGIGGVAPGLVGPATKAIQGQPITAKDWGMALLSLNPKVALAMGLFNTGKSLYSLFTRNQAKSKADEAEQARFDAIMEPSFQSAPPGLASLFEDAPTFAPTTENTYDVLDPQEGALSPLTGDTDPYGDSSGFGGQAGFGGVDGAGSTDFGGPAGGWGV